MYTDNGYEVYGRLFEPEEAVDKYAEIKTRWDDDDEPNFGLRPVSKHDELFMDFEEEDFEGWHDCVQEQMFKERELLITTVPALKEAYENMLRGFVFAKQEHCNEVQDDNAFESYDFKRLKPSIDTSRYKLKKIAERMFDLGIQHSAVSSDTGKANIYRKAKGVLEFTYDPWLEYYTEKSRSFGQQQYSEKLGRLKHDIVFLWKSFQNGAAV